MDEGTAKRGSFEEIKSYLLEDRDRLFDLIRQQRIEGQEAETLVNYRELQQVIKDGTVKKGSVQDLITDLVEEEIQVPPVKRRTFPTTLAGKAEVLSDIVSPIVDEKN